MSSANKCGHLVPAATREERYEPIICSARGILQAPRWWAFILESGVQGVEFGNRGVDVFDVEPDLQRDPTLLVDAVYLEESSIGAPGLASAVRTFNRESARRSPRTAINT